MSSDRMPLFSLDDYDMIRDPSESDEDYASRLALFRRPTPQEFVRDTKISDEAAELMDEMIARGRQDGRAPFGI